MNRTEEIIEQSYNLTKAGLDLPHVREVFKLARRLHNIHERQCNGYPDAKGNWDEAAQLKDEVLEGKIKAAIKAFLPSVEFQDDPRGAPLVIHERVSDSKGRIADREVGRVWG
jgi:hypothetical protein